MQRITVREKKSNVVNLHLSYLTIDSVTCLRSLRNINE